MDLHKCPPKLADGCAGTGGSGGGKDGYCGRLRNDLMIAWIVRIGIADDCLSLKLNRLSGS